MSGCKVEGCDKPHHAKGYCGTHYVANAHALAVLPTVKKRQYFPAVKEAREALKERAIEILESYLAVCAEARAAQDFEVASKSLQWLLEHMPNEEGERVIDSSAAKPKEIERTQPSINIGFQLGGLTQQKALSEPVIEAEVETHEPASESDNLGKESK